jgi:hypothetical protein
MDASERGAMMLVCSVAIALIGFGLAELAVTLAADANHQIPVEVLPCVLKSLPVVAGVAILIKSRAIAQWLNDLLDG